MLYNFRYTKPTTKLKKKKKNPKKHLDNIFNVNSYNQ